MDQVSESEKLGQVNTNNISVERLLQFTINAFILHHKESVLSPCGELWLMLTLLVHVGAWPAWAPKGQEMMLTLTLLVHVGAWPAWAPKGQEMMRT